jgi:hypothetical protein
MSKMAAHGRDAPARFDLHAASRSARRANPEWVPDGTRRLPEVAVGKRAGSRWTKIIQSEDSMRLTCTLTRLADNRWLARHDSRDVGAVEVRGATREEAIEKITGEIRYRLELCPCSGETYRHIAIDVVESAT